MLNATGLLHLTSTRYTHSWFTNLCVDDIILCHDAKTTGLFIYDDLIQWNKKYCLNKPIQQQQVVGVKIKC